MQDTNLNIRFISFKVLYDVFFNKKLLNEIFEQSVDNITLSDKDKSFIRFECKGVIENVDTIDGIIDKHSKVKTKKLDKDILIILRLGVFEIKYMDKVPAFATVNEYVGIVKKTKKYHLANYVNAVLRNVERNIDKNVNDKELTTPRIGKANKNCYFRIYNDGEDKVVNELLSKGIKYSKYAGKLNFKYAKVYKVDSFTKIINLETFKDGYILIQDASSTYLTDKMASFIKDDLKKSNTENISMMKLLDVCAAPGGKILGLIDLIYSDFYYFYAEARDISEDKIYKICENVNRLKVLDLNMNVKDGSRYDEVDKDKFDVVICDVPCTGLGVVAKKPDIILNFDKEKINSLLPLQKKILDTSSKYVKAGGIISYSTCTTTREENEDMIESFLKENNNFEKIYEKRIDVDDENAADGFYMCFMRRL